uniref:Dr1-associated corepressor n=1 Tax=Mola mola TaxID=94237 RepID=A0A3Q3WVB1_MOLML
MPSKKKKYNARIKKIMQTDEEIGKVAAAVPVIISRALELFLESLLTKACQVTQSRNAKTMTTSHLKQCIELEQQFDFLKDLVATVPDMQGEGEENHTEGGGGEKVPRRGRKPGSGRKNGGAGSKGKDKKLSGTESEQEVGLYISSAPPPQYMHMSNMVSMGSMAPAQPQGTVAFAPHPSMMSAAPPTAPVPHKNEDDDEDYDS